MKDSLGDRMKKFYENVTRQYLPRRTFTIIRLDGKSFHTYTKGFKRPFDEEFIEDMDNTAKFLCKNIMNVKMAYVQSDEISLVMSDFDNKDTEAWFDNNIQKMVSVSASMATAEFNRLRYIRELTKSNPNLNKMAMFDSRVFTIPSITEVCNYFIWRQQDAVRNSINTVAQSLYSHKELHGISTKNLQDKIFEKGQNWNNYPVRQKRGGLIMLIEKEIQSSNNIDMVIRKKWEIVECPDFLKEKDFIQSVILPNC